MLLLLLSLPKLLLVATCCCLPPTIVGAEAAGPPPMSVSVYALLPAPSAATVARKQKYDLERSLAAAEDATTTTPRNVTVQYWTLDQQRAFLERSSQQCAVNNVTAVAVFDALDYGSAFHSEVFKWCALLTSDYDKTLWLDSHSPIIDPALLHRILQTHDNVAVEHKETNSRSSIHGSYLQMRNTPANKQLAKQMLELILQTETNLLTTRARLVPDTLHGFIQQSDQRWHLLHLKCRKGTAKQQHANRNHLACPTGYCCSIQDDTNAAGGTVMISRHYLVPHQNIPSKASDDQERLFMATITVQEIHPPQNQTRTPNLYDILANEHCLPTGDCFHCLRNTEGATCESCAARCPCFCAKLCHTPVPTKNVVQQWTVVAPQYVKDPSRRIPRIVHQTWWEAIQPDVYPNLSRLVESFRQSGWEYRFYTDRDAVAFLQKHFPPSVFEAYQALVPGAFKADLFRYCVLLIAGGLYADVDIHLESALDRAIPPDVGFMVPLDEPGKPVNKQMCLWNGLLASAPNHPVMAKVIETVVNQVRNRFTLVDWDNTFCPNPELSVLHVWDTLSVSGPCMLGATLNRVLGRNGQTSHVAGEVDNLWTGPQRERTKNGTAFVLTGSDDDSQIEHRIPGRIIILDQSKADLGAHRFTFQGENIFVAATDLPDFKQNSPTGLGEHYSTTGGHYRNGVIYGTEGVYTDQKQADEEIRILVDVSAHAKQQRIGTGA